ncbi:MAG TPA: OmpA family protein [Fontimonas sp.]
MKNRFGLLALLLTLGTAQPALAQDDSAEDEGGYDAAAAESALQGRPWYVSPMFSFSKVDSDRGTDDGLGGVISVGKKVNSSMTLEVTGFYQQMDPEAGGGDSTEFRGIGIGSMISLFKSSPNFYALLALMHGQTDKAPGGERDYHSFVFDIGAGYLYPITQRILLRAEARYRTDQHDEQAAGVNPGSNAFTDGVFNVGFVFPLGHMEPIEEAPVEVVAAVEPTVEADSDGDGVPDSADQCPDSPAGQPVNAQGCPLDSDGDGVPDAVDECPKSPAGAKVLANGCALVGDCRTPRPGEQVDANGCAAEQNFILKGVKFEFDSDRLTQAAQQILNDVAGTLQSYGELEVELEGHTDNVGTDAYNQGLSERRANAVKTYLIGRGVDGGRMTPVGYGETQPIADNATEEGREENRRVQLKVVED